MIYNRLIKHSHHLSDNFPQSTFLLPVQKGRSCRLSCGKQRGVPATTFLLRCCHGIYVGSNSWSGKWEGSCYIQRAAWSPETSTGDAQMMVVMGWFVPLLWSRGEDDTDVNRYQYYLELKTNPNCANSQTVYILELYIIQGMAQSERQGQGARVIIKSVSSSWRALPFLFLLSSQCFMSS